MKKELTEKEIELDNRIRLEGWLPLDQLTEEYANLSATTHVDTRDFHVNFSFESQLEKSTVKFIKELKWNKKADFLTYEEVMTRLKEWLEKSGGETNEDGSKRKWRMINHEELGWFKYVRIIRTEKGFVWCSSRQRGDGYKFYTNRNLEKNIDFEQYGG